MATMARPYLLRNMPLDDVPEEKPSLYMLERAQLLGILIWRTTGEESHEEAVEWVAAHCFSECYFDLEALELNREKAS